MEKRFYTEQRETRRPGAGRTKKVAELDDAQCEALVTQLLGTDERVAAEARERIILGCLPLVARMARMFRGYERRGVERSDIVGAGNLALVEAVDGMRACPVVPLKTWLAFRVKDKMSLAVRQYLNIVSVPKNCAAECLVDVERCDDYDDGAMQRLSLSVFDDEADCRLIRRSARDELLRQLTRELPYDELTVVSALFLTDPALSVKDVALQTGFHPHKVWMLKDKAISRLKSSPEGPAILALLHECLADDTWKNTSDAC